MTPAHSIRRLLKPVYPLVMSNQDLSCNADSLGISEFPLDTNLFWQAIKFADVALNKAKESGRNKAVRFTRDMWVDERFCFCLPRTRSSRGKTGLLRGHFRITEMA